jgi:PAS domain S-box-containing protein
MKNEMERVRTQIEDLKAEVMRLQQELKASQLKSDVPQDSDTHWVSEKALHDSDERYQSLFENMLNGFAYCKMLFEGGLPKDFIYLKVNKAFETLTGLKNVVGKKASEAVPGIQEFDPEVLEIYGKVALTGKPERFEIYLKSLGSWFAISVYSPRKEYFVAVFDVITKRKQTEESLRESEERFKLAIDATNDGLWDWNLKTDGCYFSPNYYRILGYEPGDFPMEGNTWKDLIHPDDREHALRVNMDCIEGRRDLFEVEYRMKAKSGEWRWILGRGKCLARDEQGRAIRLLGTHVNITERKRAEEALRESEARFRIVVEGAPDAIFVQSAGRFAYLNPAACRLFGASRADDMLGKDFMERVAPEYRDKIRERIRFQRETGEPATPMEQEYLRLDGSRAHVETAAVPIRYQEKNAHIVFLRDITKRKQAEEALRESKDRFRNLVESAPMGIFTTSSNGKALSINLSMARILDFPSQEEAIKRYTDISSQLYVHAERRDEFLRLMLNFGRVEDFEYQARTATGRIIWLSMNARMSERREDGSFIIEGFATDITERKRAEDELRDSEKRHRRIVEASSDAYILRSNEIIIYANPAALKLFRANQPDDLIGKVYTDLVHPDDRALTVERVKKALEGDWIAPPREHRILTIDGQVVHVESIGGVVKHRGELQIFGVLRDITERRLANEKLRETEKKYRELAESLPHVIFEVDLRGNLIYLNHTGYELFGYTPEDFAAGFNVLEAFIPEDRERAALDIKLNAQGQRLGRQDYTVVRQDGTKFPAGVHAGRVMDGETTTGIRGILIDLTETLRFEDEKKKLESQLRQAQKMEAIGSLAGGIAHDFNNILSVIIGNAELLEMINVSSDAKSGLDQILNASQRAKQLVRQILAFSRQGEQQKLLISLKPVVRETLEFLRASIPATIQLQHSIKPDVGTIVADSTQMQQVLMNLCTNAAHAMEKDGGVLKIDLDTITITAEDVRIDPEAECGEYVRLTVSDTGHGIEPSVLDRIFDPYFTTKGPDKGTGLGLAVVHGIIKSHGGVIKVYSEVGKGAVFHILLPRVDETAKKEKKTVQPLLTGTERILLVDDEKPLVEIYQKMLDMLGYQVETRTSPIEALEAVRMNPQKYDLVITDMTMPQMTGFNLAKGLIDIRPDLPVILCTGFSDQMTEEKARSVGILAFLLKPVLLNDMADTLRRVLDATYREKHS